MSQLFPRAAEKLSRWSFTGDFGKTFSKLFDLQMWCFGCDIKRQRGNLLLQCDFTRSRPIANLYGSTHYEKKIEVDKALHLWGFAIVVSAPMGSICLRRHQRIPTFASFKQVSGDFWTPHNLPNFQPPKSQDEIFNALELLRICADELGKYEQHIDKLEAPGYRALCAKAKRKERKILARTSLHRGWSELSKTITEFTNANI